MITDAATFKSLWCLQLAMAQWQFAWRLCAGPIRQEYGNLYYEEAYGGADGLTVKFFESWSSIRSLYKHIYMSPTVKRVFFSEAFKDLVADQVLEGPFQVSYLS